MSSRAAPGRNCVASGDLSGDAADRRAKLARVASCGLVGAWPSIPLGLLTLCSLAACHAQGVGGDEPLRAQAASGAQPVAAPEPPRDFVEGARSYDFPRPARQDATDAHADPGALGVTDKGIFSDLDEQLRLPLRPEALERQAVSALLDRRRGLLQIFAGPVAIKVYPLAIEQLPQAPYPELEDFAPALRPGDLEELRQVLPPAATRVLLDGEVVPGGDADGDGIANGLDTYLGALKTALNADAYNQDYFTIPYPWGDVPRDKGACTDVIVRALRNAGIDLQEQLHDDLARAPKSYPMVSKPNANIDHRRVRTLLPWFVRHFEEFAVVGDGETVASVGRPGDIILMDTISNRAGPDHIGILHAGDLYGAKMEVINNWTTGSVTQSMDLLAFVPVTHHFRVPESPSPRAIPSSIEVLVVTVAADWNAGEAQTMVYRRENSTWTLSVPPAGSYVGANGMAWGRGLHGSGAPSGATGDSKREGDQRSPAGVFLLGPIRRRGEVIASADAAAERSGSGNRAPEGVGVSTREHLCIDDPGSRFYAKVIDAARIAPTVHDWSNAEVMARSDGLYDLTIDVLHNTSAIEVGAGSCIFMHVSPAAGGASLGCTTLDAPALQTIAQEVEQAHGQAALVTLPRSEYRRLSRSWGLPELPS